MVKVMQVSSSTAHMGRLTSSGVLMLNTGRTALIGTVNVPAYTIIRKLNVGVQIHIEVIRQFLILQSLLLLLFDETTDSRQSAVICYTMEEHS